MGIDNLAIKYDEECNFSFTMPPSGGLKSDIITGLFERKYDKSITNFKREKTLETLKETYEECSIEDWDNYGAKPITYKAFNEAQKIINWLPSNIPMPEIVPEPSGEIGLEWYKDPGHVFVISLRGENIITYAGIFGEGNKAHGTEFFLQILPAIIVKYIKRLYKGVL